MAWSISERFWPKVAKGDGADSCWLFTGARDPLGYGRFRRDGKTASAHRVAYELLVGPIPDGLVIDHLCRNRACVNPNHLEPVTQRVNMLRGYGMSGIYARRETCAKGHPFDQVLKGRAYARRCGTCHRDQERERYRAKKSKAVA